MNFGTVVIILLAGSCSAAAETNQACTAEYGKSCNTASDLTDAQVDSLEEGVANEMKFQLLQTSPGAPLGLEPDNIIEEIATPADRSLRKSVAAILATYDADNDDKLSKEELKEGIAGTGLDPADAKGLNSIVNDTDMSKLHLEISAETKIKLSGPGNLHLTMTVPGSPVAVAFRAQAKAKRADAKVYTNMGQNLNTQAKEKESQATHYAKDARSNRKTAQRLRREGGKDEHKQGVGDETRYAKYQKDKADDIDKEADVLQDLAREKELEAKKKRADAKVWFDKADEALKEADNLDNQAEHAEAFGPQGTSS